MSHATVRMLASSLLVLAACHEQSPGRTSEGAAAEHKEYPGQQKQNADCNDLPSADDLRQLLREAARAAEAGGLNSGRDEWAAVVNRQGELCAVAVSSDDAAAAWPGSQAIAKAKAYTANAYSTDLVPLSTARLYTLSQPGHSLYGVANANPFNPECLVTPKDHDSKGPKVCGGTIAFGGGVPLYKGKTRVGGLGASGDTACADHEVAKRMRDEAHLNPPTGALADDIQYAEVDGASIFSHPLCKNTWRNGKKVGEEAPATATARR